MNEEKAAAVMLANLKGAKKKPSDLLEFAKACKVLKNSWGFPKMADYFGVSMYMLRQIYSLNNLDSELRKLVKEGGLGIEASYHLTRLDEKRRSDAAKCMRDLNTDEIRTLVSLLLKDRNLTVSRAKELVEKSKQEKIRLLVLPLNPEVFEKLEQHCKKRNLGIHDFVLKTIEDSLNE